MLCRLTFKNVVFIKKIHLLYFSSPQSFLLDSSDMAPEIESEVF